MRCGNCKGDHEKVSEVRDCYAQSDHDEQQAKAEFEMERRAERFWEEGTEAQQLQYHGELEMERQALGGLDDDMLAGQLLDQMTGAPGRDMASTSQVNYAMDLLSDRVWPDTINRHDLENMERRQVSKLIDQLKLSPKKQGELNVDPEVGMYIERETDSIFRFYLGQRSGRILAKRLMGHNDGYGYQYVGAAQTAMRRHKLERMTLDEAKRFGRMTGSCIVCGRRLDVPESVEAGIGPKCATKEYW